MKAVIIGGGIIGLSAAHYLQDSGWEVTVLDKGVLADNCSFGNAGMIVPSHFVPLSSPGILTQGIKWMMDSKSPFYIKPVPSLRLAKWGIEFIRHANSKHVNRSALYVRDLNVLSRDLYHQLSKKPGFDFGLEQKGIMMYFKTHKVAEEEIALAEKARALGLDAEPLSAAQAQLLEPEVELNVAGAIHYRCDAHLYPDRLMQQLQASISLNGGKIIPRTAVTAIEYANGIVKRLVTAEQAYEADLFIMAGGAWLPELTRMVGIRLPLMAGKGYSITKEAPLRSLRIPAILCEARVAITPMGKRMRFGGTMEIAGINHRVNINRVKGIVESIPAYFPNLRVDLPEPKNIWYGFRPCSPDGLPYIGKSRKLRNLIIAGGHAMMGISMGPATGKLVAEMANSLPLSVRADAFDPERFS
jgi:D-amino-acid dehydrogenase